MADPRNFLLNTDYPMDMVVLLHKGSINFSVSGTTYTAAHGLAFTPLIKVVWSTDSSFTTTYGVGDGPISTSASFPFLPQLTRAYANATNIVLEFGNPGAVNDAYIEIYGYMPSDVNVDTPSTASSADNFVINTDYNYSKLLVEGVTASSSSPGSSEVVVHGLGYYPQVEIWQVKSGNVECVSAITLADGANIYESFKLTTSTLTMTRDPSLFTPEYFYYRIYADEL